MKHLSVLASLVVVLLAAAGPLAAQDVTPQAKQKFQAAVAAVGAGQLDQAVATLREAYAADQKILMLPDNGALDKLVDGLRTASKSKPADTNTGKNLAYMFFIKGMYKESLAEYKRIQPSAGGDKEVSDQIRTLEAWGAGAGGSSGGTGSGGATASSGGTGSGGASGSSGSSGGSSGSSGDPGSSGGSGASASAAPGNAEAESLKETVKKKDEEIQQLQTEKEELNKKIADLEKEVKDLQIYKIKINMQGGLR